MKHREIVKSAFLNAWKFMRLYNNPDWDDLPGFSRGISLDRAEADGLLYKDMDCDGPYVSVTDLYVSIMEEFRPETEELHAAYERMKSGAPEFKYGLSINPNELGHDGKTVIEWCLWGHGEYGRESVLEGSPKDVRLEFSKSIDVLQAYAEEHYPGLPVYVGDSFPIPPGWKMSDVPPAWFSPADAGEEW